MRRIRLLNNHDGNASVLIILIVLVLSSFGVLGLLSARSDLKLAQRSMQWSREYYEVDALAEQALGEADRAIGSSHNQDGETYAASVRRALSDTGFTLSEQDGKLYAAKDIALSGSRQHIALKLEIVRPANVAEPYRIVQWRQWQEGFDYAPEGPDIWTGD